MLRSTRTKDGSVHVLHNGGERLSGRLMGITLTAAYVDHTGCSIRSSAGGLPVATKN